MTRFHTKLFFHTKISLFHTKKAFFHTKIEFFSEITLFHTKLFSTQKNIFYTQIWLFSTQAYFASQMHFVNIFARYRWLLPKIVHSAMVANGPKTGNPRPGIERSSIELKMFFFLVIIGFFYLTKRMIAFLGRSRIKCVYMYKFFVYNSRLQKRASDH